MKRLIILLSALYILSAVLLYFFQEKLIFKNYYAKDYTPAIAKTIYFKTSGGVKLEGGFVKNGEGLPLVLYFGGNAENVLYFLDDIAPKIKSYNFISFNYPGYGASEGKPSQEAIFKYALEIVKKYKPQKVIGRSLGTAVASYVASKEELNPKIALADTSSALIIGSRGTEVKPRRTLRVRLRFPPAPLLPSTNTSDAPSNAKFGLDTLLLITPFDSIENIAKSKYPIFPISLLLKHKFKELHYLKSTKAECVNAIFAKSDEVIPKSSTQNLLNSFKFNKTAYINSSHNFIYAYEGISNLIETMLSCKKE